MASGKSPRSKAFNTKGAGQMAGGTASFHGYENVLGPMEKVSSLFNEKILKKKIATNDPRYRKALYYLLCSQTSCYRYWGQGVWTDYGRELCRRAEAILTHDF